MKDSMAKQLFRRAQRTLDILTLAELDINVINVTIIEEIDEIYINYWMEDDSKFVVVREIVGRDIIAWPISHFYYV